MILGEAAAAPVVVLGPLVTVSLLLVCAWVALVGLRYSYEYTLGALLHALESLLNFNVWKFSVHLGDEVAKVDHRIMDAIAAGINDCELALGRLLHGLEYVVRETGDALVAFGEDVRDGLRGVVLGEIPAQVGIATRPVAQGVGRLRRGFTHDLTQQALRLGHGIDQLERDLAHEALLRERGIDQLVRDITQRVGKAVRALEGEVADVVGYTRHTLARRLGRLESLVLGGAITAGALAVLTRYFPWWQCTNVRAFNRALCRAPIGGLEDFLALLFAAELIGNLDTMVRAMQVVADETTRGLHELAGV